MQADLGDGAGDGLQRLVEPVDVKGRRARRGIRLDSCFQHINIVPAALGPLSMARTPLAGNADPPRGQRPLDVGPQPNYVGDDLDAIAHQLIERTAG